VMDDDGETRKLERDCVPEMIRIPFFFSRILFQEDTHAPQLVLCGGRDSDANA